MRKVLIDRELLEYLADLGDEAIERMGSYLAEKHGEQKYVDAARTILAQPAEAEGAGDWSGLRLAAKVAEEDGPWEPHICMTDVEKAFAQSVSPTKVLELIAALSAVTAERDRLDMECGRLLEGKVQDAETIFVLEAERDQLRAEVEALRAALHGIASVNPAERGIEWAKSYASDGLKGAGSELYARWLETFKEAEALRALLNKALPVVEAHAGASHMLDGFRPARNKWDDLVDGIRAAMAAKESTHEE